ncbi:phosphate regulatory protein [Lapidilactobacillus dextrinicus DSM 20335]|uniref:Phosphate-specific transport system accessory protein PhoU n=1 Tax=Lapidilactobacillus dextrinicus DSM 20335 TaxID=1423738 RepID=A0A0R2BQX8_9LACO|nr:phosphate signaling complex protein PhoU [Lapidilactobacillus dextrinicus]KRM78697.1 phosphate regulatory protein [Lapidilactobacillus dextrinicus DSM 20335]
MKQFNDELKKLQTNFMDMGITVSEQIYQSTKSFIDHDKPLAQKIVAQDPQINKAEIDLEKQALYLMALQQPLATNFRQVISILKASSDLERIGDHAVGIAQETIYIKGNPRIPEIEVLIANMTSNVRKMLEEVLDAYFRGDEIAAQHIAQTDEEIDQQFSQIRQQLTSGLEQNTDLAAASASYLMVARFLERIGDHVVNISEWTVYSETGDIIELSDDQKRVKGHQETINRA